MTTTKVNEDDPVLSSFCAVHGTSFESYVERMLDGDKEAEQDLLTKLEFCSSHDVELFSEHVLAIFDNVEDFDSLSTPELNVLGYAYFYKGAQDERVQRYYKEKAFMFFEMTAAKNDASGLNNLGVMYERGEGGFKKNTKKAVKHAIDYYEKAAEMNSANAFLNLADHCDRNNYYFFLGPYDKNQRVALYDYFQKNAVERGVHRALHIAGQFEFDKEKERSYYEQAAMKGNPFALMRLGKIYEKAADYSKAHAYYSSASQKGSSEAFIQLGWMYENGLGVKKDDEQVCFYSRQAAFGGHYKRSSLDYPVERIYKHQKDNLSICYHALLALSHSSSCSFEFQTEFQTWCKSNFQFFINQFEQESKEDQAIILSLLGKDLRHQLAFKIMVAFTCFNLTSNHARGESVANEVFIDPTKNVVTLPCEVFMLILEFAFGKTMANGVPNKEILTEELEQERIAYWKISHLHNKVKTFWQDAKNEDVTLELRKNATVPHAEKFTIKAKELEKIKMADEGEISYQGALPWFLR